MKGRHSLALWALLGFDVLSLDIGELIQAGA